MLKPLRFIPQVDIEDLSCRMCDFEAESTVALKAHDNSKHDLRSPDTIKQNGQVGPNLQETVEICGTCAKGVGNMREYEMHIKSDHEQHEKCNLCNKEFRTNLDLGWHIETEHGNKISKNLDVISSHQHETPYSCDECDSPHLSKEQLVKHKKEHLTT